MNQIKSKQRITEHGEVFTNEREVKAMINLVQQEIHRLESRFLEPSCGNGNFLVEIIQQKINLAPKESQKKWERDVIVIFCNTYGIELLPDNVQECRSRLMSVFIDNYIKLFDYQSPEVIDIITFLLEKNIRCGDGLTFIENDTQKPITLSEWVLNPKTDKMQRKDYHFITEFTKKSDLWKKNNHQDSLFSSMDLDDLSQQSELADKIDAEDDITTRLIIEPAKTKYKPINYLKIHEFL